jgi:hypothetical protein
LGKKKKGSLNLVLLVTNICRNLRPRRISHPPTNSPLTYT